jgi:hypothetical protein
MSPTVSRARAGRPVLPRRYVHFAPDELPVPPQHGSRTHDEHVPPLSCQDPARRGEQRPVSPAKRRSANASREDLQLMTEDQKLGFALQVAAI